MSKRRARKIGQQRSHAEKFMAGNGDSILRLVLQIANDVVPFDAHSVFLAWKDQSECLWHLTQGFLEGKPFEDAIARARSFDQLLASKPAEQVPDNSLGGSDRRMALIGVDLPCGQGYIAFGRDDRTSHKVYSDIEIQHLLKTGVLLSGAMRQPDVVDILKRLHLNFLDRRTLLLEATAEEIMTEYLRKAVHVLHDVPHEMLFGPGLLPKSKPASQLAKIRPTIKLINDNGTALQIAAYGSTFPGDWTDVRAQSLYELPESREEPASITAKVFVEGRSFYTNTYDSDDIPKKSVFEDTRCHISAPVGSGHRGVIGVLAVETEQSDAYDDELDAALTLLAGHLAWPLRRALERTEFSEIEQAFVDDLWRLRTETRIDRLFEALQKPLERLGYPRGVVCRVDNEKCCVVGIHSWGGSKMDHVKEITARRFDEHSTDCQVLAVTRRERQQIQNPSDDARVHSDSLNCGELKPFSVYPIQDNHGIPRWTLHVERRDAVPLREADDRRIYALCNRVLKAFEEARRAAFEQSFYQEVVRTSFFSFADILRRFADGVVENGIVSRCRIFLVDGEGRQTPYYQAGRLQATGFNDVVIDHRDLDIRRETVPILCLRKGFTSKLQHAADDEFKLLLDCDDPHLAELNNEHRSQWVEAPVKFENRTVAKLVFDHSIVADNLSGRIVGQDDAFTLGELRLIARLTRMLSIAREVSEAYRVIAGLCCSGIHGRLLWHFVRASTQVLVKLRDLPQSVEDEVKRISESLSVLQGVLPQRDPVPGVKAPRPTVGDELFAAVDAIRPFSSSIKLPQLLKEDYPNHVLVTDRSLFLVVLTLLENCVKYVRRVGYADGAGWVDLTVNTNSQAITIDVIDNGIGFDESQAKKIRDLFENPVSEFPWKDEGALTYVAFLARELGWSLSLETPKNPTTIRLVIPTHDA